MIASVVMLTTVWRPTAWLAGLSFVLIGAGPVIWVISSTTLRQAITPAQLIGRVSAIVMTATYGARPVGALIGDAVGSFAGAQWSLALAVLAFFVQAMVLLTSPVLALREIPSSAS